ncbi:hypothetical protein [Rufibacter soli]
MTETAHHLNTMPRNRKAKGVYKRHTLKEGQYTPEEVKTLKRLYPITPVKELSRQMNRSCESLRAKAYQLGIKRRRLRHYRPFTREETERLKRLYHSCSNKTLAQDFYRTAGAIAQFARRHNLKKDPALWQNLTKYHQTKQQPLNQAA